MTQDLEKILRAFERGDTSLEDTVSLLKDRREVDLGYARVDLDRARRRGTPEVVFGQGKTPEHVAGIMTAMYARGQRGLTTRIGQNDAEKVIADCPDVPLIYDAVARCLYTDSPVDIRGQGRILVVCAGTSDLPVAQEAALTARLCGHEVDLMVDVGVAGLHRLLNRLDDLRRANVLIVCAGMEGALPSVIAGLVSRPVIAVPTSIGYGASFEGVAALLGMMSSCSAGVTVVNIDNGFGAGYAAAVINSEGSDA